MREYKKVILLLFCSVVFLLGSTVKGNSQQDINILIDAFEETGAGLVTYCLSFSAPIGLYQGDKELLTMGNRISKGLDLPIAKNLIELNNEKVFLSQGTFGNGTKTELQIIKHDTQMYINFKLIGTSNLKDLQANYILLDKKLQGLQIFIKINSCIQGNISVKLDNTDQLVLIDKILHNIGAKKVEELNTELVKSISAYSPNIHNSIITGKNLMNFQVATHNDNFLQKTVLTMGTPIIVVEY